MPGDSNITIGELKLASTAFVALVIINAVFFQTGLFDDRNTNEPPELEIDADNYVTAGEFPLNPGGPDSGLICPNDCNRYTESQQLSDEHFVSVFPPDNGTYETVLTNTTSSTSVRTELNGEGDNETLELDDYDVYVELKRNSTGTVRWRVLDAPEDDSSWVDRVPVLGGASDVVDAIAAVLGWGIAVIQWWFVLIVEIITSVVVVGAELLTFGLDLADFLITGWDNATAVLSGVSPFLTLIVVAPQLVLYGILFNFAMKILKVLPTT